MLDLFADRLGWTKAFLARGWEVTAVDLVEPPEIPAGVRFIKLDVLQMMHFAYPIPHFSVKEGPNPFWESCAFDFICASSPCEEFSVHGMKHFHPNPPYPELGIRLFEHTRRLCERSGVPYVMENVRAAQKFIGKAQHHCGPFYLWGNAVPLLMHQGIKKGQSFRGAPGAYMEKRPTDKSVKEWRNLYQQESERMAGGRRHCANQAAEIPPELAHCVAEYAERLLEAEARGRTGVNHGSY